jgi:hypothetical protein
MLISIQLNHFTCTNYVVKLPPGIALRVTESHKPHHHDKVETPLGGGHQYYKSAQRKKGKVGGTRSKHGADAKCKETFILITSKRHFVRFRYRWVDDIKMSLKDRGRRV